jgi:hypothetical protein
MYSAQFTGVAAAAQQDLFQITAPSTRLVCVHGITVSQGGGGNDVGDAQEEFLTLLMKRLTSASTTGSAGSVTSIIGLESGAPAAAASVMTNNTTRATGGTSSTLHADSWNVRANFIWIPTPEMRPWLGISERFTLELATTPATDAVNVNGTIYFEEVG